MYKLPIKPGDIVTDYETGYSSNHYYLIKYIYPPEDQIDIPAGVNYYEVYLYNLNTRRDILQYISIRDLNRFVIVDKFNDSIIKALYV